MARYPFSLSVFIFVLLITTEVVFRPTNAVGDGTPLLQYNLRQLTDVLISKLKAADGGKDVTKVGTNNFIILTGDEYVVDTRDQVITMHIQVQDTNYVDTQSFYDKAAKLKLCPSLPSTALNFDDCPITSGEGELEGTILTYTFTLTRTHILNHIFPQLRNTRQAYKEMTVAAKYNQQFLPYLARGDKTGTRPIPIMTVLFKNAEILSYINDPRNVKVCEDKPHRYISMDTYQQLTEHTDGPRGHGSLTTTRQSTGQLKVYTPNQKRAVLKTAFACKSETYQVAFKCNENLWDIQFTWLPKIITDVDPEECYKWMTDRMCNVFSVQKPNMNETDKTPVFENEIMRLGQVSESVFRTNVTDSTIYSIFDKYAKTNVMKNCPNRASGRIFVRNCIVDTNVPFTYSFPFKSNNYGPRLISNYGPLPVQVLKTPDAEEQIMPSGYYTANEATKYGWVRLNRHEQRHYYQENNPATVMWLKNDKVDSIVEIMEADVCPFTLYTKMPVISLLTDNLQTTEIGIKNKGIKSMNLFVEDTPGSFAEPITFKVYNTQKVTSNEAINIGMVGENNRCLPQPGSVHQTYMVDDTILVQFVEFSQLPVNIRTQNNWNRVKNKHHFDKATFHQEFRETENDGVVLNQDLGSKATDLDTVVCSGAVNRYVDSYDHTWSCIGGVATLIAIGTTPSSEVTAFQPGAVPNVGTISKFTDINTGGFVPMESTQIDTIASDKVKAVTKSLMTLVGRLYNTLQTHRTDITRMLDKIGQLEPSILTEIIFNDNEVEVKRSGDDIAIHRCDTINWRNMIVIPSLRLNYPDMPVPTMYLKSNLQPAAVYLSDMCFASPIVKVRNKHLGVFYAQVVDNGRKLNRRMDLIVPCQRGDGVQKFNVGNEKYTFSNSDGKFISKGPRTGDNKYSEYYNTYHKKKHDPISTSAEHGGTRLNHHFSGRGFSRTSAHVGLASDQDYVPSPEDAHNPHFHRHSNSGIRDHVTEVSFRETMDPISVNNFFTLMDGNSIDRINLQRYKRQERSNIPEWYYPYDTEFPDMKNINGTHKQINLPVREKRRVGLMPEAHLPMPEAKPTRRARRQKRRVSPQNPSIWDPKVVSPYFGDEKQNIIDGVRQKTEDHAPSGYLVNGKSSVYIRYHTFMNKYRDALLLILSIASIILWPIVLCMIGRDNSERQEIMAKHTYQGMNSSGLPYISGAAISSVASNYKDAGIVKTGQPQQKKYTIFHK